MMKKLAYVCFTLTIIISLSACGELNEANEYDKASEINNIEVVEIERYENDSSTENGAISANIAVFELRNLTNKTLQDELNAKFKKRATEKIAEYKEFITTDEVVNGEFCHPYGAINIFDYSIIRNDEKMFTLCVFEQGTRLQTKDYYNIDKATGELMKLEDFYGEHDNYLDYIADYIVKECENRNKTEKLYDLATFENIRNSPNLNNFYVKDNGKVVISFDKYMISVGAAGIVEFELGDDLDFSKKLNIFEDEKINEKTNNNVVLDNRECVKITREDVWTQYPEQGHWDYSKLCLELKNTFHTLRGIQMEPNVIYQVDMNGDDILEKVYIKDGHVYINDNIYAKKLDRCFIADLDRNDKRLEIILEGITDIGNYEFLLYNGKDVKYINEFYGILMDGYGNIVDFYDCVMGIKDILTGYYKLTDKGLERKNIEYNKDVEHTSVKLIFSENYDEIKQCVDWIWEGEKFNLYRESAEVLEEGTVFNLLDVYGEDGYNAIPFVRLQDGREGYVIDYDAIEDPVRYK